MIVSNSITQRDAMESVNSMLVYADYLDERGLAECCLVRSAAWSLEYITRMLHGLEFLPTGSRFYGEKYATSESDWDWFAFCPDMGQAAQSLGRSGFEEGGSASDATTLSHYVGNVNIILLKEGARFTAFCKATDECAATAPENRDAVLAIFEKHGAKKQ